MIARGDMLASGVAKKLLSMNQRRQAGSETSTALSIGGGEGSAISYAGCCGPIPGDQIMGYVSPGKGVVIHSQRCPNVPELQKNHPERCITARWEPMVKGQFRTLVRMVTANGPGVLASISTTLGQLGSNIESVEQRDSTRETATLNFVISVADRDQLARVLRRLRRNPYVMRVSREFS
jgi:guanosine-3',5'-bis(diphosphate) 3'-pyrophosphohydrolase